ncbi:MAG: hypothetical protein LBP59_05670 [Planctomycetaceae bacterium]|nr:hypothetical protein [Planctomycetaceae bacterium]
MRLLSKYIYYKHFKLFALEFSFTFACLDFGRQASTLLNCSHLNLRFTFA